MCFLCTCARVRSLKRIFHTACSFPITCPVYVLKRQTISFSNWYRESPCMVYVWPLQLVLANLFSFGFLLLFFTLINFLFFFSFPSFSSLKALHAMDRLISGDASMWLCSKRVCREYGDNAMLFFLYTCIFNVFCIFNVNPCHELRSDTMPLHGSYPVPILYFPAFWLANQRALNSPTPDLHPGYVRGYWWETYCVLREGDIETYVFVSGQKN